MKKILCVLLILALVFTFACSKQNNEVDNKPEEKQEQQDDKKDDDKEQDKKDDDEVKYDPMNLVIPSSSTTFDKQFAKDMLTLCTGNEKINSAKLLESAGFEVLVQKHFEKSAVDASHNSAFTIGKKTQTINDVERVVFIVTIRGTNGAEWISNFDFASSKSDETTFAENFLACANDIYSELGKCLTGVENPVIIVSGHSRGGACANLVGYLVDKDYPVEDVYVYTFATPTTIRNINPVCNNIFNIINTSDVITKVPLESMGYKRVGVDINGCVTTAFDSFISTSFTTLSGMCTSISSYYNDKHSLTASGLSKDGVTLLQLMTYLSTYLSYATTGLDLSKTALTSITEQSDLYPIVELANTGMQNNLAINILSQHMPQVYSMIIQNL